MSEIRRPVALVTGASSGIGAALAGELAADGHDLLLVARSQPALAALAGDLAGRHGVAATVLPADLAGPGAAAALFAEIGARGVEVDVQVNNAGIGDNGRFDAEDPARIDRMIALNIAALTRLTRLCLPGMVARKRGRVLNVASTAAFQPGADDGGLLRPQGLCAELQPGAGRGARRQRRHGHRSVPGRDRDQFHPRRQGRGYRPLQPAGHDGDERRRGRAQQLPRAARRTAWWSPAWTTGSARCWAASCPTGWFCRWRGACWRRGGDRRPRLPFRRCPVITRAFPTAGGAFRAPAGMPRRRNRFLAKGQKCPR